MSEKTAVEIVYAVREAIEESVRWMFRVGAEGELFGFGSTVGFLWLISFLAGRVDALTFLYSGTPYIYIFFVNSENVSN